MNKHLSTVAITDVIAEMNRQDEKWGPDRNHHPFIWNAILSEEVGEFAQAILHDEFGGEHKGTARAELVQIAAVALQIIEMYDRLQGDNPDAE
ncbi:MazG-like family protein [Xenorhabdus szentirmaii]|uniref:MazG-like family protein n=1 Tax=Xenorhabdus szentirmaii TaxID=290112 RepID=UPI0019A0D087|nr:MazG-like family protein [Xenorhabdus sp. 38]MBD2782283.1 MazG-like family protein [Xenorhabdus sp. 38]